MNLFSRRLRLKKAVHFAESLAKGESPPLVLEDDVGLPGRLLKALIQIAEKQGLRHSQLETDESQIKGILTTMSEGVLLTDKQGRILLANEALKKMFQLTIDPKEKFLIEAFRQESLQKACDQLLLEKGRRSFEISIDYPEEKILRVNFATLEKGNRIEGVVGIFIDVTKNRKLEEMRKEFVANISHELKTPLSSIKGYSETLKESGEITQKQLQEFASIIHRNAQRLERLVEDIMALSRLEHHEEKLKMGSAALPDLAHSVSDQLKHLAELKGVSLEVKAPENLSGVSIDIKKIEKVFSTILENAIKYSPEKKKVLISLCEKKDKIEVQITDEGSGIKEEDLGRIFERFYRVERSRTRVMGGSGLGLAIAKHIVLAHGGEIWAESQVGHGSSFFFTLPLVT